jgi:hypothetical protein
MLGTQHSHYSASGDSNMAYMGPGINNAIFAHPGQGPFACADGAQIHGGWNDTILLCRNFAPGVVFNTILNGSNNREKGNHGLIAQGDHDFIDSTADYATILNGTGNSVEGDCGLAIGKGAHAGKDTALFHDSTGMFVVKADGFSGHLYGVAETANYALSSGATKSESFTPSGVSDTLGRTGDIRWDASYIYVKTESGWKRAALRAW